MSKETQISDVPHDVGMTCLSINEAMSLQKVHGKNIFTAEPKHSFARLVMGIVKEPMFLMLIVACFLYFLLGEYKEGILMLAAIIFVAAISMYQEVKSSRALDALKQFTQPKVAVIRDSLVRIISTEDLVPGDLMILEEGDLIPADASIRKANDLTVNESIITGESVPVSKSAQKDLNQLFQGTTINTGKCYASVTSTGNHTVLGRLGKSLTQVAASKTLLQRQIASFVKRMAIIGMAFFLLVWLLNYLRSGAMIESLLLALTLAMAIVPEEIPVAFSSFMALGAFHMAKRGIITRNPLTIENLGAVSVVCLDKTGTITENKMEVKLVYDYKADRLTEVDDRSALEESQVIFFARLASEAEPFDTMEKAIIKLYKATGNKAYESLKMVHEYPLGGHPPMMTHVYKLPEGSIIVAGKGAPERVIDACKLGKKERRHVHIVTTGLAAKGYRILAICSADFLDDEFPRVQDEFNWHFEGLLALYDPPRKGIEKEFKKWQDAGVKIKLVTGDFKETALNVANQVGLKLDHEVITGNQVMLFTNDELNLAVQHHSLFVRMFPDAKLRLIEALKVNSEIVAMMGDGVNDAPALKAAHIGIAMGAAGTEIAHQAADLIITDDNLGNVTEAITQGRKIYHNLKKAIRYIISIHIPIVLTASLPLLLKWPYPNIFTPIHIIFFELIMGPTCSIFFEKEPVETGLMKQPPRQRSYSMFSVREFMVSMVQGLFIASAVLFPYYYFMAHHFSLSYVRTIVFITLITSNIFLTFANRSFEENIITTIRYKNALVPYIIIISVLFLGLVMLIEPVRNIFQLTAVSSKHFTAAIAFGFAGTFWFELYKMIKGKLALTATKHH